MGRGADGPGWSTTSGPRRSSVEAIGRHEYTVEAWVDRFASWFKELGKKVAAGQEVESELLEGAEHVREAIDRTTGPDGAWPQLGGDPGSRARHGTRIEAGTDPELLDVMNRHPDRSRGCTYDPTLGIVVERVRARYGSWYEFFPRSTAANPGEHGTFRPPPPTSTTSRA